MTINVHLNSRSCLQHSQQVKAEQPEQASAEGLGTDQTNVAVRPAPTVLQPRQTTTVPSVTGSASQAAKAHHAALHADINKGLAPRSSCWNPTLTQQHELRPQMHVVANGLPPSPCNKTWSDTVSDCPTAAVHFVPIPHAELVGEYRIPDFVTEQEERELVHMVDTAVPQWKDSTFNGKHRSTESSKSCAFIKHTSTWLFMSYLHCNPSQLHVPILVQLVKKSLLCLCFGKCW